MYGSLDLESLYTDDATRQRIVQVYALSKLFEQGIRLPTFTVSPRLNEAIQLTLEGQRALKILQEKYPDTSLSAGRFAVFTTFAHNVLLVDVMKMDVATLSAEFAASIMDEVTRASGAQFTSKSRSAANHRTSTPCAGHR